jgi:hypothetical protein
MHAYAYAYAMQMQYNYGAKHLKCYTPRIAAKIVDDLE